MGGEIEKKPNRVQMGRFWGAMFGVTAMTAIGAYYTPYDGTWFSWHPLLAVIAYVWCMSTSIILLKSHQQTPNDSFWSKTTYYAYLCHNVISGLGWLLGLASFYVIYSNKEAMNKPHITSSHAWAGVCVLVLMAFNVALGLGGYYFPKATKNFLPVKPLKLHHQMGNAAWIIGLLSIATGYLSHRWGPGKTMSLAEQVLLVATLPATFWLSKKLRIKPKKTPEQIAKKKKAGKKNVAVIPPVVMFVMLQTETALWLFTTYVPFDLGELVQVCLSYGVIIRYFVQFFIARKDLK